MPITTRPATPADAAAIAKIYNQGIEDRIATFETRPRTPEEITRWFDGVHPIVVAEEAGQVVGFASTSSYRPRDCYSKTAEFSVYVGRDHRGRQVGGEWLQRPLAVLRELGGQDHGRRVRVQVEEVGDQSGQLRGPEPGA